jgi:hypothetical protein
MKDTQIIRNVPGAPYGQASIIDYLTTHNIRVCIISVSLIKSDSKNSAMDNIVVTFQCHSGSRIWITYSSVASFASPLDEKVRN